MIRDIAHITIYSLFCIALIILSFRKYEYWEFNLVFLSLIPICVIRVYQSLSDMFFNLMFYREVKMDYKEEYDLWLR